MRVHIFVQEGAPLSTISGPLEALQLAASYQKSSASTRNRGSGLQIQLVSANGGMVTGAGGLRLETHQALARAGAADLVVLGAIGNPLLQAPFDARVLASLQAYRAQGTTLASICTGAFLLAESGVLNGHLATTHWAFEDQFRQRFPRVQLTVDQIITQDDNLICSGGATAYIDLSLFLIEKYFGAEIADRCGKLLLADRRASQAVYADFAGYRQHGDLAIKDIQRWLDLHYAGGLTADQMAERLALSRRQFNRRFKQATGHCFLAYLQRLRVEKAKYLLSVTDQPVDAIASRVGYEDTAFFRRLFKREVGLSPQHYRGRQ